MNAPRENPRSRGERGPNDQRGERGRSAPRGERGAASGGRGRPKRPQGQSPERKGGTERGTARHDGGGGKERGSTRRDGGDQRPATGARVAKGGVDRKAENRLSVAARERLAALRADYEPGDGELPEDRDEYQNVPGGIRLQKALAQSGVASRRASEEMIAAGRVTVDGHTVRRFGARVDPSISEIRVDGMRVATAPDLLYYALNKPRGVVSTMWDPEGRRTLADYTGQTDERLFHVGRLDTETEGLILLTNDGELANRLTHPRYEVAKTYVAKVPGMVPRGVVTRVRKGVELDDGPVRVDSFRVLENLEPKALVEVKLHEGRKHIVRRLLSEVGHPVEELARTQVGPIGLNTLKPGTTRILTAKEVSELYTAAGM